MFSMSAVSITQPGGCIESVWISRGDMFSLFENTASGRNSGFKIYELVEVDGL